jgi:hypothetical protein
MGVYERTLTSGSSLSISTSFDKLALAKMQAQVNKLRGLEVSGSPNRRIVGVEEMGIEFVLQLTMFWSDEPSYRGSPDALCCKNCLWTRRCDAVLQLFRMIGAQLDLSK